MDVIRKISRPNFVSFSGIDGAGKSTQIEALCMRLREYGWRVQVIRFWDDIARLTRLRETAGHSIFKGDKGIGTPSLPINRRDKNVKSVLMTAVRLLLYLIDAISLRVAVQKALRTDADLVIFDRYTYDELANLTLSNPAIRMYIRLITKLVPEPDVSYFLDADPAVARARKPEYPLEFLYANRQAYLDLKDLIGTLTVIAPMPVQEVRRAVLWHAIENLTFSAHERENDISVAMGDDSGELAGLDRPKASPSVF